MEESGNRTGALGEGGGGRSFQDRHNIVHRREDRTTPKGSILLEGVRDEAKRSLESRGKASLWGSRKGTRVGGGKRVSVDARQQRMVREGVLRSSAGSL